MNQWSLTIFFSLAAIVLLIFLKKKKFKKEEKKPINEMDMSNNEINQQPSANLASSSTTQSVSHSSQMVHKQLKDITILDRLGGGNVS